MEGDLRTQKSNHLPWTLVGDLERLREESTLQEVLGEEQLLFGLSPLKAHEETTT